MIVFEDPIKVKTFIVEVKVGDSNPVINEITVLSKWAISWELTKNAMKPKQINEIKLNSKAIES